MKIVSKLTHNDFFGDVRMEVVSRVFKEPTLNLTNRFTLNHRSEFHRSDIRIVDDVTGLKIS
jgi:hypothetical protein